MDKFREAQEQFEAKEFEILGLQSTNENKGLKPRPRPPLTIKSIVTSPCSRPVKNELRWRPGMETSGYENPLHDSVPHTPAREAHQDQHRTRDGGDRRCLKPDELEHVGPGSPDTSTTRSRSSQDKGPDRNPDQTRFDLQGLSVIMGPIPNCFCNLEAKTWISYTPKHRKKTFYRCRKDQENQCQFFEWTQFQTLGGPGSVEARHR